ncbi:MAG: hypothetical protein V7727_16565, partial [Sneathiella sp.]
LGQVQTKNGSYCAVCSNRTSRHDATALMMTAQCQKRVFDPDQITLCNNILIFLVGNDMQMKGTSFFVCTQ